MYPTFWALKVIGAFGTEVRWIINIIKACTSNYVVISLSHDMIFVVIMSFVSIIEYMMFPFV